MQEGRVNVVSSVSTSQVNGQYIELLNLYDGRVVALSCNAIALYKNTDAVQDILGNGCLQIAEIPENHQLDSGLTPWVKETNAGYVGLNNDMVILILPNDIRLYLNKKDALNNFKAIASLKL